MEGKKEKKSSAGEREFPTAFSNLAPSFSSSFSPSLILLISARALIGEWACEEGEREAAGLFLPPLLDERRAV